MGTAITKNRYQEAMQNLLAALQWECLHLMNEKVHFHKDHASYHHDANVQEFFLKHQVYPIASIFTRPYHQMTSGCLQQ
jgi:hypothetical protein